MKFFFQSSGRHLMGFFRKLRFVTKISRLQSHFRKQNKFDEDLVKTISNNQRPKLKQFKYLPKILTRGQWLVVRLSFLLFTISLVFLIFTWWTSDIGRAPDFGGTYSEGVVGSPSLINPLYASLNQVDLDLTRLMYAGLLKFDREQQLITDLAENWEKSADEKNYTFNLKRDIKWSDGEDFNADDVVFTIASAVQDSSYSSPLSPAFNGVKVEKLNEYQVRFTLNEPFTPFLENLTIGILPEHLWSEIEPTNARLASLNLKPVGLGPYLFESLIKDDKGHIKSYTLVANKKYHFGSPNLEKIIFKFYPDSISAVTALKNKNIDGLSYLSQDDRKELISRLDLKYYTLFLPQYTAVFLNQRQNEILRNVNVRQALAYAIDKETIVNNVLKGEAKVINGPLLPGYPGYHPGIEKFSYNPDKAKELLENEGWKLAEGASIRTNKDKIELVVNLTVANRKNNLSIAEIIKKNWQSIGVKVNLEESDPAQIQKNIIKPRNYQALIFGEIVGADPDPYPFWHSSQIEDPGLNLALYANKEADQVLEEARKTSDTAVKNDKYIHFQNIIAPEVPAIFLYNPTYTYVVSEKVKGINMFRILTPQDRFDDIGNWYIETRKKLW